MRHAIGGLALFLVMGATAHGQQDSRQQSDERSLAISAPERVSRQNSRDEFRISPSEFATSIALTTGDGRLIPTLYQLAINEALSGAPSHLIAEDFASIVRGIARASEAGDHRALYTMIKGLSPDKAGPLLATLRPELHFGGVGAGNSLPDSELLYRSIVERKFEATPGLIFGAVRNNTSAQATVSRLSELAFGISEDLTWEQISSTSIARGNRYVLNIADKILAGQTVQRALLEVSNDLYKETIENSKSAITYYSARVGQPSNTSNTTQEFNRNWQSTSFYKKGELLRNTAAGISALAYAFGDQSVARDAEKVARTAETGMRVAEAAVMLASASTGVGAVLAVGSMVSAVGALNGENRDGAMADILHEMFDYMRGQFSIVNLKIDHVIRQLDGLAIDIAEANRRLVAVDTKLDELRHEVAVLGAVMKSTNLRVEELSWRPVRECLGYIESKPTDLTSSKLSECMTTFFDVFAWSTSPEQTFTPYINSELEKRLYEESFVRAIGGGAESLERAHISRYASALHKLEEVALGQSHADESVSVNTAVYRHAVNGLASLNEIYPTRMPWSNQSYSRLQSARKILDAVESTRVRIVGVDDQKTQIVLRLVGDIAVQGGRGGEVWSSSGAAGSYASTLAELVMLLAAVREQVLDDLVTHLGEKTAFDNYNFGFDRIYERCSSSMKSERSFSLNDVYTHEVARELFPTIYSTRGGRRGNLTGAGMPFVPKDVFGSNGPSNEALTGGLEICVHKFEIKGQHRQWLYVDYRVFFSGQELGSFDQNYEIAVSPTDVFAAVTGLLTGRPGYLSISRKSSDHARKYFFSETAKVLNAKVDEAKLLVRRALDQQLSEDYRRAAAVRGKSGAAPIGASCHHDGDEIWVTEIKCVDTVRSRFLNGVARRLTDANDPFKKRLDVISRKLSVNTAMLRAHVALAFPAGARAIDILRMSLIGSDAVRLADGALVAALIECLRAAQVGCNNADVQSMIEEQFFERAGRDLALRLRTFRNVLSKIRLSDFDFPHDIAFDELAARTDLLLSTVGRRIQYPAAAP